MKHKSKIRNKSNPIEESRQQLRHVDVDEEAEVAEDFLEKEGPFNDRRERISPEYRTSPAQTPSEMKMIPDGQETYSEEKNMNRARGENPKGSSQHESKMKTMGRREEKRK